MSRLSITFVVLLFLLNGASIMLVQSGWAADTGINPNPGGDERLSEANQSAQSVNPSGGTGQTLFAMFSSIGKTFNTVFEAIFAAPIMAQNLGVPSWVTAFFFGPMYIYVSVDVAHILTGRFA